MHDPSRDMIPIPGGDFVFGVADPDDGERPKRECVIEAFHIARSVVTVSEWKTFLSATSYPWGSLPIATAAEEESWKRFLRHMGKEDSMLASCSPGDLFEVLSTISPTSEHPVVFVSWFDAMAYCDWLSSLTGRRVSLPTEIQWERACRGPASLPCSADEVAYDRIAAEEHAEAIRNGNPFQTLPVTSIELGTGPSGCIGMWQNVSEWCLNRPEDTFPDHDQLEFEPGNFRAFRGGSVLGKGWLRCTVGGHQFPQFRHFGMGFRVVDLGR